MHLPKNRYTTHISAHIPRHKKLDKNINLYYFVYKEKREQKNETRNRKIKVKIKRAWNFH